MKKLWYIPIFGMLILMLVSCTTFIDYIDSVRPEAHAPALTENEASFVEMLPQLQQAGIAITNSTHFGTEFETRKGSGVIIKKEVGSLSTTYYALTTQWVVENALTVSVYTAEKETVSAVVLNKILNYEANEDIALIKFVASDDLKVVPFERIDASIELDYCTIFSVATPISNGYLNYVTNPALIMGVYDMRIVHGTNLNPGTLGSPLYLKSTGQLIGINVKYSFTTGGRPEVLLNEAIHINRVIDLIEGYL